MTNLSTGRQNGSRLRTWIVAVFGFALAACASLSWQLTLQAQDENTSSRPTATKPRPETLPARTTQPRAPGFAGKGRSGGYRHVVYIMDASSPMTDRLESVKQKVLESVGRLRLMQDFDIIFFAGSSDKLVVSAGSPVKATEENKAVATEFLQKVTTMPSSTRDPVPALEKALKMYDELPKADRNVMLVYLLAGGAFKNDQKMTDFLKKLDSDKVQIDFILFTTSESQDSEKATVDAMKEMAKKAGGEFKLIRND